MTIGLLLMCTGKYKVFLQPLIDSVNKHFFNGFDIEIYLFTDEKKELKSDRAKIIQTIIPSYTFPFATLYRYKTFHEHRDIIKTDYVYYSDVDMLFVDDVGIEMLPNESELTAIRHPGFYQGGWGSQNTHRRSTAYLHPKLWRNYYCGGFQGGTRTAYLAMAKELDYNIEIDLRIAKEINFEENSGILAEYHDESHYNWYMAIRKPHVLNPSYCYPESWELPFKKKILALDKKHHEIRA